MKDTALRYLNTDRLHHMGMILPIQRGTAEIIHASGNGVFLRETESAAFMLSVTEESLGASLLASEKPPQICVFQRGMYDYLVERHDYTDELICVQMVYEKDTPPVQESSALDIKALNPSYSEAVTSRYHEMDSAYVNDRLQRGEMYGGFINGEMCCFAGTHPEGGIGLLEVHAEHRGKGFGAEMLRFMTKLQLDKGQVPYSQIKPDNLVSIGLHEKLGYTMSAKLIYWLM